MGMMRPCKTRSPTASCGTFLDYQRRGWARRSIEGAGSSGPHTHDSVRSSRWSRTFKAHLTGLLDYFERRITVRVPRDSTDASQPSVSPPRPLRNQLQDRHLLPLRRTRPLPSNPLNSRKCP